MEYGLLDPGDFSFRPYLPHRSGDSGALCLAVHNRERETRYVVKSESPELACNEFMYRAVAASLGLRTLEARLFRPAPTLRHAVGIFYREDLRPVGAPPYGEGLLRDLAAYKALFVILNEEDSEEYFLLPDGALIKLDKAASFNLGPLQAGQVCHGPEGEADTLLRNALAFTEYDKYAIQLGLVTGRYGKAGRAAFLSLFRRFSMLDIASLEEALDALDEVYPADLSAYFAAYLDSRRELCTRFLSACGE